MALITPGPLISAISGTLGGANFAQTQHGIIARPPLRRTNQKTSLQIAQRAKIEYVNRLWQSLTDTQRASWVESAAQLVTVDRLARKRTPSAAAAFRSFNLGAWTAITGYLTTAPDPFYTAQPTSFTLYCNTTTSALNVTKTPVPYGPYTECFWGSVCYGNTAGWRPRNWTLLLVQSGGFTVTNIWSSWVAALPTPLTGQLIAVKYIRRAADEFPSAPYIATTTTVTT